MKKAFFSLLLCFQILRAEVIYLNDGSILHGVISDETAASVTVQTKYQKRTIQRTQIKRILYGERDLEEIYLLMKDGERIHAWQVIQDNEKVIIRRDKDSPQEETILKKEIRQMGNEEIAVFNPELGVSGGLLYFCNSGSSKLDIAWIVKASMYNDIPFIHDLKGSFDLGYAKGESSDSDLEVTLIPVSVGAIYEYTILGLTLYPKVGFGATMVSMNDNVKDQEQGLVFTSLVGGGASYSIISDTLFVKVEFEELSLWESSSMHMLILSGGLGYRF